MNNDNNDELFKKAAEHYPLNTEGANWNAVLDKMNGVQEIPVAPKPANRFINKALALLLLLVPLKIYEHKFLHHYPKQIAAVTETNDRRADAATTAGNTINQPATGTIDAAAIGNLSSTQPIQQPSTNSLGIPVNTDPHYVAATTKDPSGQRSSNITGRTKRTLGNKSRTQSHIINASAEETTAGEDTPAGDKRPVDQPVATLTEPANPTTIQPGKETVSTEKEKLKQEPADKKVDKQPVEPATETASKSKPEAKPKKTRRFYIGIAGGPDFSTIKMQSVKKTGFNYGFVAGYHINKRFSVETGLFKDKKLYSTDGKYFNTKNIYLPGYADIEYVTGECNMLEVPLNLYVHFRQRERSSFFASAGVSSYFMNNESYVYDVNHNGVRYPKSAYYDKKSTSIAAVINISAGYSHRLGKIADLRLEPYLKLPVHKIGTGSLPIQSAGLTVTISKNIF